MFPYMDLIKDFGQYWFVTITPYGRDIEPNVPDKHRLIEDFKKLSDMVGVRSVGWRYDPIYRDGDSIHEVPQESWIDMQESLFAVQ